MILICDIVAKNKGGKKMVNDKICIGCGTCVNMCPVGAISFDKNGKAKINPEVCVKCKTCEGVCPVSAITIKED